MTAIHWDTGSAYDFFVSLFVLHHAPEFGLRPSWAAGVRQRVSSPARDFLESYQSFAPVPLHWILTLAEPKDAATALATLAEIPAGERLAQLSLPPDAAPEVRETLLKVAGQGRWDARDQDVLRSAYQRKSLPLKGAALANMLELWSRPVESGEALLSALQHYWQGFFAEEEERIRPALETGLSRAQEMAGNLPLDDLVEQLSGGIHLGGITDLDELVLVPSYWSTPLIFINHPQEGRALLLFGTRPEMESIVPGEDVPEGLVNALKSLADPTRMRILRYLAESPHTPAELSRRLRLRPPTVIHHLRALRLAGLVHITITGEHDRRYAARLETLDAIVASLKSFLSELE